MTESRDDISISEGEQTRIRERVLKAEKEKLDLDNPMGVVNNIEEIIEEEINEDTSEDDADEEKSEEEIN